MTLSKLIANDIVNYGMDQTSNFDYSVFLDSYIDDFDQASKEFIYSHLDEICHDIESNANVSYFEYHKDSREFDMVFYWDNLMDANDKYIYDLMQDMNESERFELEDIKEISGDLLNDQSTKNLAIEKIRNNKKMEMDI